MPKGACAFVFAFAQDNMGGGVKKLLIGIHHCFLLLIVHDVDNYTVNIFVNYENITSEVPNIWFVMFFCSPQFDR